MTIGRSNLLALAILGVAAPLRLYDLANAQFRHDDEAMFYAASQVVGTWQLPIAGMESSIGIPNGPTAVYAWLPPLALGGGVFSTTAYVALLNVVTIGLAFICTRQFFGTRIALVAALLFAVNPWAVIYSRRMWLNAAIPLLAVLFFWSTLGWSRAVARPAGADDRSNEFNLRRYSLMLGLSFSALLQTHLSGIAHLGTAILVVYLGRLWTHRTALGIAGLAFALTAAPYFVGVVAPRTARVLLDTIGQLDATTAAASEQHIRPFAMLELLTSHGYQAYATQAAEIVDARRSAFVLVDALLIGMFFIGVATLARRAWGRTDADGVIAWLPLVWIAVPCFALTFLATAHVVGEIFPFYFLVTFPALFIVAAEGWDAVWRVTDRWGHWTAAVPTVVLLLIACVHTTAAGAFVASIQEYRPEADYGLPLQHTHALAELITSKAEASPIVMLGHTDVGEIVYRLLQKDGRAISYFDDRTVLPSALAPKALYVTMDDDQRHETKRPSRHGAAVETWSYTAPGGRWSARLEQIERPSLDGELVESDGFEPRNVTMGGVALLRSARVDSTVARESMLTAYVRWRFIAPARDLVVVQLFLQNTSSRHLVHEASFFPLDLWRKEDGAGLMNADLDQRMVFAVPADVPPGDYTLSMAFATRWGRRPLEGSAVIGTVRVD